MDSQDRFYRGAHWGCHGVYLFLTLCNVSVDPEAIDGTKHHVRAVGLVGAPRGCENGGVLLGFPRPDAALQELVLDGRLVDHVGHPGVPCNVLELAKPWHV